MDWSSIVSKLNPNTVLIAFIGLTVMGVDVIPALFPKDESEAKKELAILKKEKERDALKDDILKDLTSTMEKALEPLTKSFQDLNKEMQRGSRWSLEMVVKKWELDGKPGADPREVHREFLAEQRLRNISRQEGFESD